MRSTVIARLGLALCLALPLLVSAAGGLPDLAAGREGADRGRFQATLAESAALTCGAGGSGTSILFRGAGSAQPRPTERGAGCRASERSERGTATLSGLLCQARGGGGSAAAY
jgi:hypothetical protein